MIANYLAIPVLLRKFICCLLIIFPLLTAAQTAPVILHANTQNQYLSLEKIPWRFSPGNDPQWAQPSFNDQHWDTVRINFGEENLPANWNGTGWFRLWIKKENPSSTDTWGFFINHDAASEVYLDGKRITALGKQGDSKATMESVRQPFFIIPLALPDTLPHLIAIRYTNYAHYFPEFVGFQAWISDWQHMYQKKMHEQRFADLLLMSVAAQAVLILLHLLLFAFYPKHRINLYYSLFVLNSALVILFRYFTVVTTDPAHQVVYFQLFYISIYLMNLTAVMLLYHVSHPLFVKWRIGIVAGITTVYILYIILHWNSDFVFNHELFIWIVNISTLLIFGDGTIAVFRAIIKGNKKLWLIGAGMVVVCLLSVGVGANAFKWFTFHQVMTVMAFACLLMPVLFSIYIAIDIAATNRKLSGQLEENKKLAAENLAHEQEKTRLITGQAEKLERTVQERTAQVQQQTEQLREMDAAKSRFFVNLTHEFKTPLTLIANPAKELWERSQNETDKQYAGYILQNSERLLQLINQLLDLSRLESGNLEVKNENIELVRLLTLQVQQFGSMAEHKNASLQFITDTNELRITSDADKIGKIVQNLISNALKFIDNGGTVQVSLSHTEIEQINISVQDNGIGIPKEKLPYVFDRFYQVDATDTRSREGTGIGLALCKELTILLGGSITVSSTLNSGTVFTVSLPLKPESPHLPEASIGGNSIGTPSLFDEVAGIEKNRSDADTTVLVVEDNEQLRRFLQSTLELHYTVLLAEDGAMGAAMATETVPNLVITDLMMPVRNGYELCEMLKTDERTSHIPVIMLTAKTDLDSRIQGIETGADAYLAKPFDKEELLALIRNLIQSRKQLMEKFSNGHQWLTEMPAIPSIEQQFLEKVRTAIENHIDNDQLSTDFLGKEIGLSRTQLHRKLKDLIGQSPGELIRTIRMLRAHELLQKNAATVAEVSYLVGYTNPSNFSTSFSKHFGYPPSDLNRKKQ